MDIPTLLDKAAMCFEKQEYVEVEIHCRRVLLREQDNSRVYLLLAELAVAKGNYTAAAEMYEKYVGLEVPDREILLKYGDTCRKSALAERAFELFEQANIRFPQDEELRRKYFETGFGLSRFDIFSSEDFSKECGSSDAPHGSLFFHTATVVWGEAYTATYADYILPTLLGESNIGALSSQRRALHVIYTTPEDAARIRSSRWFESLLELVDVRFYMLDGYLLKGMNKYESMTTCHRFAIREAVQDGARLMFLAPDVIFSGGTFRLVYEKAAQGFKGILSAGLSVVRENWIAENPTFAPGQVSSRDLVRMAVDHLHPDERDCFVTGDRGSSWPSHLFWSVPDGGILAHFFHLHPLMVDVSELRDIGKTVDSGMLGKYFQSVDDVYVAQDSDEVVAVNLCPAADSKCSLNSGLDMHSVAAWAREHSDDFERSGFVREIRFHGGDFSSRWDELSVEADSFVRDVLDCVNDYSAHSFSREVTDYDLNYASPSLDTVHCQFTSSFNTSGPYSPQHRNRCGGSDLDRSLSRNIVDHIRNSGVNSASMEFDGECLGNNDWLGYVLEMLDHGMELDICSDFNTSLSHEQCSVLSRFRHIRFSVDTVSADPLREVDFEAVLLNINNIRAASLNDGRTVPSVECQCLLTYKAVDALPELVALVASNGVSRISCNDLPCFDDREFPFNSVYSLEGESFKQAIDRVAEARELAAGHGVSMNFPPFWDAMIKNRLVVNDAKVKHGVDLSIAAVPVESGLGINMTRSSKQLCRPIPVPGAGETRACLFPWISTYIDPEGDIYSCPIREQVMGRLTPEKSLSDLMDSKSYVDLRRQLITGHITDLHCRNCHITEIVPLREMKRRVAGLLRQKLNYH